MKMWIVEHIHLDTEQGEGLTCDLMNGQTHGCEEEWDNIIQEVEEDIDLLQMTQITQEMDAVIPYVLHLI